MATNKAYACTEEDEGTGGIIFAATNLEARKSAASIWGDGELKGWRVHRAPGLDQYEKDGVPTKVLIADGWWFECHGCGIHMDEDNLAYEGLPVDGVVGKEHGRSYCCHTCRIADKASSAAADAYGQAFLDMMKEMLRERFAGEDLCFGDHRHHVYVRPGPVMVVEQAFVTFGFPGSTLGGAHLRYEKNGLHNRDEISCGRWFYTVPRGNAEAYEEWASQFPRKGYI